MPQNSTKKRLKKRLQWYYQVEGMNVAMFLGIMIFLNAHYGFVDIVFLSFGLLLMCFILFQGTYYWWIKLSVLNNEPIYQKKIVARFQNFKKKNLIAIGLIPVVFLLQWFLSGKQLSSDNFLGWAIFANVFAILEYINYYYKQLMYDNLFDLSYLRRNKRLKEASLYKDLRENKI